MSANRLFPILLAALLLPVLARAAPDYVLTVYSNNRLLPANIEIDRGMNEVFAADHARKVELFVEFLDAPAFSGPEYENVVATYLREKYAARPPRVIAFAGQNAFAFMTRHGDLFPGVPLVHIAVDRTQLDRRAPLPPQMVGVPVDIDYAGSIRLGLQLQPHARHLVIVTGASNRDLEYRKDTRAALAKIAALPPVEFLDGLPTRALEERLASLDRRDVVFTPGFYRDGDDHPSTPREAAELIAKASAAPVYGPYSTFIGSGIVGGSMPTYLETGRQAASIIEELLAGTAPGALQLPSRVPTVVQLDWRQLRRWGIKDSAIPADALVHFREPTFWETYRDQALVIAAVIALQFIFIAALLVQRRQQRRGAAALAASEARMTLAARAARLFHWTWDTEPARRASSRLQGSAPVPIERVLEAVHPEDRDAFEGSIRHALASDAELDIEYRTTGDGGETRWFAARGRPEGGVPGRLVGVALDITERKEAVMQAESDRLALKHLTRVATLGELSASIAHQLNQPLAAILGNAEVMGKMLARDPVDRDELKVICADIVAEDKRASDIIRRMGALYKRGELNMAPFDLNELVRETADLLRTELLRRQVATVLHLDPSLLAIEGERVQMQQVLMNLILNAADAMDEIDPAKRKVSIRTELDGTLVRLSVLDRGHGIAPPDLERVFDAFWSTKGGGLGMGLAICRSIVAAHHGSLVAANNGGEGAAFFVSWPMRQGG